MTSPALLAWRRAGQYFVWRGHRIFFRHSKHHDGQWPLLLIHGYPTSSYDWIAVWSQLESSTALLAPDLLGLGFSDKPNPFDYSIECHADMLESLLAHCGIEHVHVLCHDLGVSIAQELLARQLAGRARCSMESLVMLNGGLCPEAYQPRPVQRVLAQPWGAWLGPLLPKRVVLSAIRSLFSPHHQPSDSLMDDYWEQLRHGDGRKVAHAVGRFWLDRLKQRDRLVGALVQTSIPIRLINGAMDPNSGRHMAERYRTVMHDADIVSLDQVGHWPQLESAETVVTLVLDMIRTANSGCFNSGAKTRELGRTQ